LGLEEDAGLGLGFGASSVQTKGIDAAVRVLPLNVLPTSSCVPPLCGVPSLKNQAI